VKRILGAPYRAFFLAAGLYAVFAMLVWLFWLAGQWFGWHDIALPFGVTPQHWHAHELIFGYSSAAVGGFLLTAVPSWTGGKGVAQAYVGAALGLWLAGRAAIWCAGVLPAGLVALLDLSFLPLLALQIAMMLVKRPKPQNVAFLVFITLLWLGNLMVHLEWMAWRDDTLASGLLVGLFALCLMIAVLGGRVTPAFTRNAMKRAGVPESGWPQSRRALDLGAIGLIALTMVALLTGAPDVICGALALLAGVFQLGRVAFWKPLWTLRQPIVWSLHLGMVALGAGLVVWGLARLGWGDEVAALHVLGIGAIAGMTVAVMSRAILGHTGRALIAPAPVAAAYGLIAVAALMRWGAGALGGEGYFALVMISGGLWTLAFALYVLALWPAFAGPRQASDTGKPAKG